MRTLKGVAEELMLNGVDEDTAYILAEKELLK